MKFVTGNIFDSNAEALVNTVNTVGVMGKGVALQFKDRFPLNFDLYSSACKNGEVQIGKMFITSTNRMINPKWIINFPTKKNWLNRSSYAYIEKGLDDLINQIIERNIKSIAIPPLGAGQGGLEWDKVKEIITDKLKDLSIEILVFEPVKKWPISAPAGKNISLTKPRALVLALIERYHQLGFEITLLEIQKLAYFLQRMGQEDLKLNYKRFHYGPYAHNLQHLLHKLENDFIITHQSILDSKPLDVVYMNYTHSEEISNYIKSNCSESEKTRLNKVTLLMKGYESPFGLELLSTVDWIFQESHNYQLSPEVVKDKIREWSERKDNSFTIELIKSALDRLHSFRQELSYS